MSSALMQTYVYSPHGDFLVSTINRESSAALRPGIYTETLVWKWNCETKEREEMIGQGEGPENSTRTHWEICERLMETGRVEAEES